VGGLYHNLSGSVLFETPFGNGGGGAGAPEGRWYDNGMTTTKIAITLPEEQLVRVQRAVRAGRAESVSGYITRVLEEQEREESLRALVQDLIAEHGEPTREEKTWAKRALGRRRRV
jgi:hypothetical protein